MLINNFGILKRFYGFLRSYNTEPFMLCYKNVKKVLLTFLTKKSIIIPSYVDNVLYNIPRAHSLSVTYPK